MTEITVENVRNTSKNSRRTETAPSHIPWIDLLPLTDWQRCIELTLTLAAALMWALCFTTLANGGLGKLYVLSLRPAAEP